MLTFFAIFSILTNDKLDETSLTHYYVIKLIAFFTSFVKILGQGLYTYSSDRYRQVAKRIARIIRHSLLYVADMIEIVRYYYKFKFSFVSVLNPNIYF